MHVAIPLEIAGAECGGSANIAIQESRLRAAFFMRSQFVRRGGLQEN